MKKLFNIITLEKIVTTYDTVSFSHKLTIRHSGECFEEMLDMIIRQLNRLLASKTRLTYRNVLVANYEKMTNTEHWLNSRLYSDVSKETSIVLKRKVKEMVNLMKALVLKINHVDGEHADRFFKRLTESYQKNKVYDYDLWKSQIPNLTLDLVLEYQAELTADMLIMGILEYDRKPSDRELDDVRLDLLNKKLRHKKQLPDNFKAECAKLRRYSYWVGHRFIVDYPKIRDYYLYKAFGKLSREQHVALFYYDAQMRAIHEDILRFEREAKMAPDAEPTPICDARNERIRQAIISLLNEKVIKRLGDYGIIMTTMNQSKDLPHFDSFQSFVTYLQEKLHIDKCPSESIVRRMVDKMRGGLLKWTYTDTDDDNEVTRRNNVGRLFLSAYLRQSIR
jgi:hypothetical protein